MVGGNSARNLGPNRAAQNPARKPSNNTLWRKRVGAVPTKERRTTSFALLRRGAVRFGAARRPSVGSRADRRKSRQPA